MMEVSVIVNSYDIDRYPDFCDAINALLHQTYANIEIILVIDGNDDLYDQVNEDFGGTEDTITYCTPENVGNSASRSAGAKLANGDIIAVTDDDAIADANWIEELVWTYESTDAIAAGGKVEPIWMSGRPDFFPEEFLWLVGCTEKGFATHLAEIRNTYGPNISFRKDIFDSLGGFSSEVGRHGEKQTQAHETEICARMQHRYNRGVIYNENAMVRHKVYDYQTQFLWLVRRCFWQGYSKRILEVIVPDSTDEEYDYLKQILRHIIPNRVKNLITNPNIPEIKQLLAVIIFTITVGFGYIYGIFTVRK